MIKNPPDTLPTNYIMLELLLNSTSKVDKVEPRTIRNCCQAAEVRQRHYLQIQAEYIGAQRAERLRDGELGSDARGSEMQIRRQLIENAVRTS